ncbi:MAG: regulatory protein RecX [Gordonia sp. (in: high G+C Gram-positive bacteria)]|uniref:regulatory protein RecX n=1 Tax=Gordonia sp. (in: high G+C Gram-positive bacteria) TaxID=84139 RepID=UPI0039E6B22A
MPEDAGTETAPVDPDGRRKVSAWDAALRLLGVRARSRSEIRERLVKRGFTADEIDACLARLDKHHLLDDEEFAREWVRSRGEYSRRGSVGLRHELRAKGVDETVVAAALAEVDPDDERRRATELVERKLSSTKADLGEREVRDSMTRRLTGMLLRRGFPQGVAIDVVREQVRRYSESAA